MFLSKPMLSALLNKNGAAIKTQQGLALPTDLRRLVQALCIRATREYNQMDRQEPILDAAQLDCDANSSCMNNAAVATPPKGNTLNI